MADVFDVAAYILNKKGRMTTMKLQKLLHVMCSDVSSVHVA